MGSANVRGSCSNADIFWSRTTDRGTCTGAARCATPTARSTHIVSCRSLHAELTACLVLVGHRHCRGGEFSTGCSIPTSLFGRYERGFLDLANDGEFVLDRVVGNQYPHGLASVTGTEQMFCVDQEQSIFFGGPVQAQLREALPALEREIAPDLLVKLCDVGQLDLLFQSESHDHS